jgi:hypothetical protein
MIAAQNAMTPPPAAPDSPAHEDPAGKRPVSIEPVRGQKLLVVAMSLTLLATAALILGVLVLVNQPDWWRGFLPATVVGLLASGISLVPLLWGMQRGPHKAVLGFFVAGALRAAVALGGGMLAAHVGGYPLAATLLLIVAFYFAALAVESAVLAKALWRMKL